ncbi:HNH endonuclease [Neorhizobium galegae]|uniref:HNH endonuclease signature motif containing protein n=1 Tax=Neorhizobium galegae TaxID=399 RepID=UPI00210302C4|nr:HNH endonuclease [Neorhizobium galegae]MCQ1779118.1 HNH endonuclease [Neorhizobium galegae]MCQ1799207.1 HNH endonuclease [Neorhizobium galegae]
MRDYQFRSIKKRGYLNEMNLPVLWYLDHGSGADKRGCGMAGRAEYFGYLDGVWERLKPNLGGTFTTYDFQKLVEVEAPDIWARFVAKWGPGGKGSGNRYSPARVLFNYLDRKANDELLVKDGYVKSTGSWGSPVVIQFRLMELASPPLSEEDLEFSEGKPEWKLHLVRERHTGVRANLLKARAATGIFCEICGATGNHLDKNIRNAMFEVHHATKPMSDGERKTTLKDLALLCVNCHRLIHKLVAVKGDWVDINEAKRSLLKNG